MRQVTAKDLMNEQERRLQQMRNQEKDNAVDMGAKSLFFGETVLYIVQQEVKTCCGSSDEKQLYRGNHSHVWVIYGY